MDNRQLISEEYRSLNAQLHVDNPHFGVSSSKWADLVTRFADQLQTRDILDYGCGKGLLKLSLNWPIQEYDPAIPGKNHRPNPADFVVCTDVLEHIEPDCLDAVLDDLVILTKKLIFLNVSTCPARKFLPDGRNAHLIQEKLPFWVPKFLDRFTLLSLENEPCEFTLLAASKQWNPWPQAE